MLYEFTGGSDGIAPVGAAIVSRGVIYGSTFYGGETENSWLRYGIRVEAPAGSWGIQSGVVIGKGGALYRTTYAGGAGPCSCTQMPTCGTVFSVMPPEFPGGAWTEAVHYNFTAGSDGAYPQTSWRSADAGYSTGPP